MKNEEKAIKSPFEGSISGIFSAERRGLGQSPIKKEFHHPHEKHRQRVRQKYLKTGLEGFADHEVLELLLFYGYPQGDVNEIAHRMLNQFHSLPHLFESDVPTLMEKLKCTERIAVLLNLIPKIANLYFVQRWNSARVPLNTTERAVDFAIRLFAGCTIEHFYVFALDSQYQLINKHLISEGTVHECAPYFRNILSAVVADNARAIIMAHNHPSGTIRPSRGDDEATRSIAEKLNAVDIFVVDHIIIAGENYFSYATRAPYGNESRKFISGYPSPSKF